MKLIVITIPDQIRDEAEAIDMLFEEGLEYLHLRKPGQSESEIAQLLDKIASCHHRRIILHDHYQLAKRYSLGGIHLNGRNPVPEDECPVFSASCHTPEELMVKRPLVGGYLFLSPVFDSISKEGYKAAFTEEQLRSTSVKEMIGVNTVALGGVTSERIPFLKEAGFAGVAVLGALWNGYNDKKDIARLKERFNILRQACL